MGCFFKNNKLDELHFTTGFPDSSDQNRATHMGNVSMEYNEDGNVIKANIFSGNTEKPSLYFYSKKVKSPLNAIQDSYVLNHVWQFGFDELWYEDLLFNEHLPERTINGRFYDETEYVYSNLIEGYPQMIDVQDVEYPEIRHYAKFEIKYKSASIQ